MVLQEDEWHDIDKSIYTRYKVLNFGSAPVCATDQTNRGEEYLVLLGVAEKIIIIKD